MKIIGIVQGSAAMAVPLFIGKDIVYVHTDIQEIQDEEGNTLYRYHEIQYTKDEYLQMIVDKNKELEEVLDTVLGVQEEIDEE